MRYNLCDPLPSGKQIATTTNTGEKMSEIYTNYMFEKFDIVKDLIPQDDCKKHKWNNYLQKDMVNFLGIKDKRNLTISYPSFIGEIKLRVCDLCGCKQQLELDWIEVENVGLEEAFKFLEEEAKYFKKYKPNKKFKKELLSFKGYKICSNKDCIHKGKPQLKSNFHKRTISGDGLDCRCKDCTREKTKKYRNTEAGKIVSRISSLKYSKTEKGKIVHKKSQIKFKKENPNYQKEWIKKNPQKTTKGLKEKIKQLESQLKQANKDKEEK